MSFQEKNQNYRNDNCIHKRSCRFILESLIDEVHVDELYSLTLPATNFELENRLMRKYNGQFNFVEINKKVYDIQRDLLDSESMSYDIIHHNDNALNIVAENPLNFIWLDFCGYLTAKMFNSLVEFMQNNPLQTRGIFAITLLSGRQNKETQKFYRDIHRNFLDSYMSTLQNFKSVKLPKIFKILLEQIHPYEFELVANYSYKPTSGGGIMTMYAFKWSAS